MANEIEKNNGEIIIYQSEDGKIRLDVIAGALFIVFTLFAICVCLAYTRDYYSFINGTTL